MEEPGRGAIGFDIGFEKLGGFWPKLNLPVTFAFTEDGKGSFFRIKVIEFKFDDFTRSGPGIIEQMQQAKIPEALVLLEIDCAKHAEDLLRVEKTHQGLYHTFLRDMENPLARFLCSGEMKRIILARDFSAASLWFLVRGQLSRCFCNASRKSRIRSALR